MSSCKKFGNHNKNEDMRFDDAERRMFSRYDYDLKKMSKDKQIQLLKPRNVNKNCVR